MEVSVLREGRFADATVVSRGALEATTVRGLKVDVDVLFAAIG